MHIYEGKMSTYPIKFG